MSAKPKSGKGNKGKGGKGKRKDVTGRGISAKAGITFPVGRIKRFLKEGNYSPRIGAAAPIYMAAVLEYVAAEILELSGSVALEFKKNRITPRHIQLAIRQDEELNIIIGNAVIMSGGVMPHIEPELVPNNKKSKTGKQKVPTPCAGGCGFYGSAEQKNYCSQCYKKMYPEEANKSSPANKPQTSNTSNSTEKSKDNESKEDSAQNANDEQKPKKKVQKKKNRCWNCRKKVTLAGQFECKCGYVFCSLHRYPDAHECDFDWKKQHQDKLAQDNKTVAPSKLDKI